MNNFVTENTENIVVVIGTEELVVVVELENQKKNIVSLLMPLQINDKYKSIKIILSVNYLECSWNWIFMEQFKTVLCYTAL